jgi:hypothetical protein
MISCCSAITLSYQGLGPARTAGVKNHFHALVVIAAEVGLDLLGGVVGAVHGEADFEVAVVAVDLDGDLGASAIFLEHAVEGFEQGGLPAGDHLGGGGVGADVAAEIEGVAVFGVGGAVEVDVGAGDLVVEGADEHHGVGHGEVDGHVGGDFGFAVAAVGLDVLGLALGAHTETVDAVLEFGAGELDALDVEFAVELKLMGDAHVAGRDVEPGLEVHGTTHDGCGLHGELEHVFDAAVGHVDGEGDVVTLAFDAHDGALAAEAGVTEGGLDGIEGGVAVRAVDEGVEFGFERHGMAADVE